MENSSRPQISDSQSVSKYRRLKKLFCSIRLLLNTDTTCRQRLWSYDRMA